MRVPVRLGAEGPRYYGPRHAPLVNVTRRARYYGGDIRNQDPLSLVFRGHMGARLAQDTELTLQWPTDAAPAIDPSGYSLDIGAAPAALDSSWLQSFEVPAPVLTADILTSAPSPPYVPPAAPAMPSSEQIDAVATQPTPTPTPSNGSAPWWQVLPGVTAAAASIVGAGATIARAVTPAAPAQVYNPATGQMVTVPRTQKVYNPATGQMVTVPVGAAPTTYTIPATATMPAQQVTYNPATGQVTTVPLTGLNAMLPSFLQSVPGAPWYQNPLVWVGAGGGLLLLVVLLSARR